MPAIVCRDHALAAVTGALARPPALVLLEGEAGIGKTRLVRACLEWKSLADRTVLAVDCQPLADPVPLGPVVEGLHRLREQIGGVQLSPLGGALRPLFPEWAVELPPSLEPMEDAQQTRGRVYRALTELVDRLRVEVLVFEDAHWADTASLEWLLTMNASGNRRRSVIVTYRPQEVPSGSLLWQVLSRVPAEMTQVRIELDPLTVTGIQQLTRAMFGIQSVSSEFAEFLHERTGGLPLAVEECLRLLRERGDISQEGDGWARRELIELRVPPTVRDSVLERVGRQSPEVRRVLEAAAVLAEPADDRLLAKVAGLDAQTTRSAVAAGLRAGLLGGGGPGRVTFRHQLAAKAVETTIPVTELQRMHQQAGEALQRAGGASPAHLSRHFKAAGDTATWSRYAEASADLAAETGDDHTAVSVLHDLLTTVDHNTEQRVRLARKLGQLAAAGAAVLGSRIPLLVEAFHDVLTDGDIPVGERGEIRLQLGRLLFGWPGHRREAYEQIEAAVSDLVDRPVLACQAMLLLGTPLPPGWSMQRHVYWVKRAAAQLSHIEQGTTRLGLVATHARALLTLGDQDGWHAAAQIPRQASSMAERRAVADGLMQVGVVAIDWGGYTYARSQLAAALELVHGTGYQRLRNVAQVASAFVDWCTGHWENLGKTAAVLARAEETEPQTVRLHAQQIQGLVDLAHGRRAAAKRHLRTVLDGYMHLGMIGPEPATAAAALGRLHLAEQDTGDALQVTELVMAMIAHKRVWLWAADLMPVHLDALVATGELTRADDLTRQYVSWQAGRKVPAAAAASRLCQGIIHQARGELARAALRYAQASEAWAALPHPYNELLAQERHGQCLLATDQPAAVAVLSDARQRLQQLGARWDAARITRQLRQQGTKAARNGLRGSAGYGEQLSPREVDVLALVAKGLTNKEAGQELFLSPRTIGTHLSRAMRKLQASTRTAAARTAAEAGLIPATPEQQTPDTRSAPAQQVSERT